jgi:hypothetical protein
MAIEQYSEKMKERETRKMPLRTKPSNKRIKGEGIQYYNPYKPKKQGLIERYGKQYWKDGYYTDSSYLIKLEDKPKLKHPIVEGDKAPNVKWLLSRYTDAILIPAKIAGMFYHGDAQIKGDPVLVDVVSSDETVRTFVNVRYIDSVTTKYPGAWVFINTDNKSVVFKEDNQIVAVVMPIIVSDGTYSADKIDALVAFGYNRLYGDLSSMDTSLTGSG